MQDGSGYNKQHDIADRLAEASTKDFLCLDDTHLTDEDLVQALSAIADNHNISEISLDNNPVTDAGIMSLIGFLKAHPKVNTVSLNLTPNITDDSAVKLLDVTQVTTVLLWKSRQISDVFARAVLEKTHLEQVDLRETSVTGPLNREVQEYLHRAEKKSRDDEGDRPGKCNIM